MQNNIFAAICETLLQTSLVHLSLLCPTCFLAIIGMYALSLMPKNHYLPTLNWWKYLNLKSSEEKEVLTSNTHSHDLHLKKSSHRASNFWNRKHISLTSYTSYIIQLQSFQSLKYNYLRCSLVLFSSRSNFLSKVHLALIDLHFSFGLSSYFRTQQIQFSAWLT